MNRRMLVVGRLLGARRPSLDSPMEEQVEVRETLGGRALVLLAWTAVASAVASKLLDDSVRVILPNGGVEYQSNSNIGGVVGVILFAASVAIASVAALRDRGRVDVSVGFSTLTALMIAWWIASATLLRRDSTDTQQLPFIIGAVALMLGIYASPPTFRTLHTMNTVRDVSCIFMLLSSFIDPLNSQLACRADKCGIFGSLFTGFFYTENSAAQFVLLLVPATITLQSRARVIFSSMLAAVFLLATGSRTSLLTLLAICLYVLAHRRAMTAAGTHRIWLLWRLLPLAALAVSTFQFLVLSGSELTGRGAIYAGIRAQLHGYALLVGSGPDTMQRIFRDGLLRHFQAFGEHGEAPHLLVQAGIPALVLFGLGLATLVTNKRPWSREQVGGFGLILAASLQFVTEPGWTLSARSLNFVLMLLAVGLFWRGVPRRSTPDRPRPRKAPGNFS